MCWAGKSVFTDKKNNLEGTIEFYKEPGMFERNAPSIDNFQYLKSSNS